MINSHQSRNSQEHPRAAIFSQATKRCLPDMFVRFGGASRAAWVTLVLLALSILNSEFSTARAQGTAFTYQGRLNTNGGPANGSYDFNFTLWSANSGGSEIGGTLTDADVGVTNGLFTVTLDFGSGIFTGRPCWLQINVETNGVGPYVTLSPRQQLTPTPNAIYAENSGGVNNGTISAPQLNTLGVPASGQVLEFNGTNLAWANAGGGSSGWSLTGNSGTIPGTDFMGTTDNEPLEIWVNNTRALRLEPGNGSPNVVGGIGSVVNSSVGGATIGGGEYNTVGFNSGNGPTIGGGLQNTVSNLYPTVSGGEYNQATANGATVGGGYQNTASGGQSTVGGGVQNTASGTGAFIGGGGYDGTTSSGNMAQSPASTAVAGVANSATASYATVVGGYGNTASGEGAFVGGGFNSTASGFAATMPGGVGNLASGSYSFAAGDGAQAVNNGSFVWADFSSGYFPSTANNQFSVRAGGGVRFVTGGAGMTIDGVQVVPGGGGGGGSTSNSWLLTGNAGANPTAGYFLGTTDTNGLELHVNSQRGLRLDYASVTLYTNGIEDGELYGINVNNGYWGNTIAGGVVGGTIAGGGSESQTGFEFTSRSNNITADYGTIGGGYGNYAGNGGTVPGGYNNWAVGTGSFAAGSGAQATYDGEFVWGDGTKEISGAGEYSFNVLATGGVFFNTTGTNVMAVTSSGNVGINTTTPIAALEVNGSIAVVDGAGGQQAYIGGTYSGNVYIGSLNPNVAGVSFINLNTLHKMQIVCDSIDCTSITIEGGSDLAEPFQFSSANQEVAQGAVVVIDEANPGHLKLSDQPYDARVAGVVSGANGINPGIQMQQKGLLEGGKNVALTGRVYVQADASNGAIKPGDLLTSSTIPGHAMRVSDHAKAQGAILGKAMTELKDGQGMVLVLVTLQ